MNRLTTDAPKSNFETLLNMVYGKDGWGYIRSGDQDKPIQDFVLELCKKNGCGAASVLDDATLEERALSFVIAPLNPAPMLTYTLRCAASAMCAAVSRSMRTQACGRRRRMHMKTPEEIKKGLECCSKPMLSNPCKDCPYDECGCVEDGKANVTHEALTYIEQLEEQIQLMKVQMHGDCGVCKHRHHAQVTQDGPQFNGPCAACIRKESRPAWEYEGLPELPKT